MAIDKETVQKIAHLARLALHSAEVDTYASDLSNLLQLIEKMNAAPTTDVAPMAHPLQAYQRLRPDVVTETDQRDYLQRSAPQVEAGLYLVPPVIEQEG